MPGDKSGPREYYGRMIYIDTKQVLITSIISVLLSVSLLALPLLPVGLVPEGWSWRLGSVAGQIVHKQP